MNNIAACAHPTSAKSTLGTEFFAATTAPATRAESGDGAGAGGGPRAIVWSIAGSDSGAGAGLQADLKALFAFGVHGCSVVAAITAQNSQAVTRVQPVSPELLDAQLAALAQDMPPGAIKTGLLGSVANVRVVCAWVDRLRDAARARGHSVALVVDPVLGATTGAAFASAEVLQAYVDELLPRATLITPNRAEAARLLGQDAEVQAQAQALDDGASVQAMAHALVQRCPQLAVVITGGDVVSASDTLPACDWLQSPQSNGWLSLPRVDTPHHHGTGCTFASTAAAALASGYCVADAVVLAKMATTHALRHAYAAGQGAGPVCAQGDFAQHIRNLPTLHPASQAVQQAVPVPASAGAIGASSSAHGGKSGPGAAASFGAGFAPLIQPAMGVYAVVDSALWVRRVLAAGIRTVQLRIKDPHTPTLAAQIQEAVAVARDTPGAQLFINDHWQLAIAHGAYGVHLGQEDLEQVDLQALRAAGLRLGLSTHSYWEVCRAWAIQPSYIACGPIFATQSKDMPWIPQGLDNLRYWAQLLPLPVVGIAGIGVHNVAEVAATGAASAAVITAITQAADPAQACRELMAGFAREGC